MATKQNTLAAETKRLCDDVLKARGGLKASCVALGKSFAGIRDMDARKAAFNAAFAYIVEAGVEMGYAPDTWAVYKSTARAAARIPAANRGNGTKGSKRKGSKRKGSKRKGSKNPPAADPEGSPAGDAPAPDTSTPKSTLAAWKALIPALKRHGQTLASLVKDLEAAYQAA